MTSETWVDSLVWIGDLGKIADLQKNVHILLTPEQHVAIMVLSCYSKISLDETFPAPLLNILLLLLLEV